jgi:hypothetical protein
MWHAWQRREKCTRAWWESLRERDHLEDRGVGGRMGMDLRVIGWGWLWSGVTWFRVGTDGGLLWVW